MPTSNYQNLGQIISAVISDGKQSSSANLVIQITRWINEGYEMVALRKKWDWLDTQFAITLPSSTQTVCTVTQGSNLVQFTSSSSLGMKPSFNYVFYSTGYNEIYNVLSTNTSTFQVTLVKPYTGTTNTSTLGILATKNVSLDSSIKRIYQVYHQWQSSPVTEIGPQQMRAVQGSIGPDVDYAQFATIFGQDSSGNQVLEYYPYPDTEYTLYVDANVFITPLVNNTDQPLIPMQSRQILYHYAMYKLFSFHRNDPKAQEYNSSFNSVLTKLEGEQKSTMDYPQLQVSYPRGRKTLMFANLFDKRLREYPSE